MCTFAVIKITPSGTTCCTTKLGKLYTFCNYTQCTCTTIVQQQEHLDVQRTVLQDVQLQHNNSTAMAIGMYITCTTDAHYMVQPGVHNLQLKLHLMVQHVAQQN